MFEVVLVQGLTSNENQRPKLSKGRGIRCRQKAYRLLWLRPEKGGVCSMVHVQNNFRELFLSFYHGLQGLNPAPKA